MVWDLNAPSAEPLRLRGHEDDISDVSFDPQGTGAGRLASASKDGTVRVWDLNDPTVEPLVLRGHNGPLLSVAFDPHGPGAGRLASSGENGNIRVWDLNDPRADPLILRGSQGGAYSLAFDPHDKGAGRVVSAGADGKVLLWDLDAPAAEPLLLYEDTGMVTSLAFDPGNSGAGHLASGGADGNVRVWSLSRETLLNKGCGVVSRNLSPEEWKRYFGGEEPHLICPDLPIHPDYLATGEQLAATGEIDRAVAELTRLLERFKANSAPFDPKLVARRYPAYSEARAGDVLARAGETEEAASRFQRAVELDSSWRIVPASRAAEIASWSMVTEGDELARAIDFASAIKAYERALELYPARAFVPEHRARRIGVMEMHDKAPKLAKNGNLDQALLNYGRAVEWGSGLPMKPEIENGLCWFGSLWNRASEVMDHCERAVASDPTEGQYRDSRGVARALTGDLPGAAEDFSAFLTSGVRGRMAHKRREWIEVLESGRNPIDIITLEAMRRGEY